MTLSDFADETAARTPTPGGGAVCAYVAQLGAALGAMAARFTEGRKGFEAHGKALAAEIALLDALRGGFAELVDADARAYGQVTAAYGLPKETDEDKAARRAAIQGALVEAMETPLSACRAAISGLEVLTGLDDHVNQNLASDVAVGAHALACAWRGAWVNVLVNLRGIRDEALREKTLAEGREMAARVEALESEVAGGITASLLA
ncbi:MAG: cyclodeaminase/cyclohydrolase family protein [Planctomycetota bacterium]